MPALDPVFNIPGGDMQARSRNMKAKFNPSETRVSGANYGKNFSSTAENIPAEDLVK